MVLSADRGRLTKYNCTNRAEPLTWVIYSSGADFCVHFGIFVLRKCEYFERCNCKTVKKADEQFNTIGAQGEYRIPTMITYGLHPLIGIVLGRLLDVVGINKMLSYFIMFFLVTCFVVCGAIIMKKIPIMNFIFNGNRK